MEKSDLIRFADKLGFKKVYFTPLKTFDFAPDNPFNLVMDAKTSFDFASSIVILVYPYRAFNKNTRIPSYYPASNSAYHALSDLIQWLENNSVHAVRANIPVKAQCLSCGIGTQCRNSLISIPPFGTRIVLSALAVDCFMPQSYDEKDVPCELICHNHPNCAAQCPANAIDANGLIREKCIRFEMENAIHSDRAKSLMQTYIGCEVCQYACPRNNKNASSPTDDLLDAFDTKKLIAFDTRAARKLVGKNMSSNGKLSAEAIIMAARDEPDFFEKYEKEIEIASNSSFPAISDALNFVRKLNDK